jgi:hypothetical protein
VTLLRALAAASAAAAILAGCALLPGGARLRVGTPEPRAEDVSGLLATELREQGLSVRAVDCLDSGLVYEEASAFLCTVNFGDPHLVPYCVAIVDLRLVTDRDEPALVCYPPEDAERYRENAFGYRE